MSTISYRIDRHRADLGMPGCSATSTRLGAWLTVAPTMGVVQLPKFDAVTVVTPVLTATDAVIADAKGAFPGRPAWSPPI